MYIFVNFLIIKESNWNAPRMPSESLDCRSNAARMQFECPDQDARKHLDCRLNIFRYSRYLKTNFSTGNAIAL